MPGSTPDLDICVDTPASAKGRTPGFSDDKRKNRRIQLDFVRGIAILTVMAHHFISWPRHFFFGQTSLSTCAGFTWVGVDLFFVLSGFLVGGLLIGEIYRTGSLQVGRFFKRRLFRIWPAYYAYLLFQVITHHFPMHTYLVGNLLHVQNYLGTSLEHTWSLAVQEHFYLLLPGLLLWMYSSPTLRRRVPMLLLLLCVCVLLMRSYMVFVQGSTKVGLYTHTRVDSLIFGVLLAHFSWYHRPAFERICKRRLLLAGVFASGLVFLYTIDARSRTMLSIGYTLNYIYLGAFVLLILGIDGAAVNNRLYQWIARIGVYSYSIYLWHNSVRTPLFKLCRRLPGSDSVHWFGLYAAQYLAAILLGVLMAKAIEWPFLRLRERLVPSTGSNVATTQAAQPAGEMQLVAAEA